MQRAPSTLPTHPDNRDKRYGWYRLYENFPGHKKWRMISKRIGVPLVIVEAVVMRMFQAASMARAKGYLGSFDVETCAADAELPSDQVAIVYRTLCDIGFVQNNVIVDWDARNPRDTTATDRQRNKRERDSARRAVASGTATDEQKALLTTTELDALEHLARLSRVTAPSDPQPEVVTAFEKVRASEDSHPAREAARLENENRARVWLLGNAIGSAPGYGIASKLVAEHYGCTRLSGDTYIRRWLREEMAGDVVELAVIISGAEQQALNGDAFRTIVEGAIVNYVRQATAGPSLPFGPMRGSIGGGKS